MVRLAQLALALFLFAAPAHAQQAQAPATPGLPAVVSEEEIAVKSDYRGSTIDVWGVNPDRRGRGDIVVVMRGPNRPATVMRKRRVWGLWVNGPQVRFAEAPSYFAVLSTRPLRQIVSPAVIWSLGLDPAASAQLEGETPPGTSPSDYRAALVRLRRQQGLYLEQPGGLRVYEGGLFRARVSLPANAPIATYHADTYLFRNGQLVSSQRVPVSISRVGFERRVHNLANNASLLYGVVTLMLALGAGWLASVLFRRP